jgi:hypothetical protein
LNKIAQKILEIPSTTELTVPTMVKNPSSDIIYFT